MQYNYVVFNLTILGVLLLALPVYAGEILVSNGITFESPEAWEVVPMTGDISIYPPQQISPDVDGITLSVSRMPDSAPKDTTVIWAHMEANFRTLGVTDYQVLEQQDTTVAGRPAKVVVYTEQEFGINERSRVYAVYLSASENAPILVIRYSGALSKYDRFWPDARKMIDSVRLQE